MVAKMDAACTLNPQRPMESQRGSDCFVAATYPMVEANPPAKAKARRRRPNEAAHVHSSM